MLMSEKQEILWNACHANNKSLVMGLLDEGVDACCSDEAGITPLMIGLASRLDPEALEALAQRSDFKATNSLGESCMHWAARESREECLAWAKDDPSLVLLSDHVGRTPAEAAARRHWGQGVSALLGGAPSGACEKMAKACLSSAIASGLSDPSPKAWERLVEGMELYGGSLFRRSESLGFALNLLTFARFNESIEAKRQNFDAILEELWLRLGERAMLSVLSVERASGALDARVERACSATQEFVAHKIKKTLESEALEIKAHIKALPEKPRL